MPPVCLDIPYMFGCLAVCLITPHMFGHPHIFVCPVCLDAMQKTCVCMNACIQICSIHVNIYVCRQTCMYICMYIDRYACICMYV